MLCLAALIRLTSRGPALFRQTRVGTMGREFTVYKFRSMVINAEARLTELTHHDEGNGVLFKMRSDPRVTRIGNILRRYSLDELPQLFERPARQHVARRATAASPKGGGGLLR